MLWLREKQRKIFGLALYRLFYCVTKLSARQPCEIFIGQAD